MSRVGSALLVCVGLIYSGCATDAPPKRRPKEHPTPIKVVTIEKPIFKKQTCTAEIDRAKICGMNKYCTKDPMTCAEAYYRLTICGHWWLDGGIAGKRNGIPCQSTSLTSPPCGKDAKGMTAAIIQVPFFPPTKIKCIPPQ